MHLAVTEVVKEEMEEMVVADLAVGRAAVDWEGEVPVDSAPKAADNARAVLAPTRCQCTIQRVSMGGNYAHIGTACAPRCRGGGRRQQ